MSAQDLGPSPALDADATAGGRRSGSRAPVSRTKLPWRHRFDVRGMPYLMVSPFFILFAIFGTFPILYTLWVSLTAWNTRNPGSESKYVGFKNFQTLWSDDYFWNALKNTFGIGIMSAVPQLILALAIAHLLNYKIRGRLFFRTGVLVPYVTSVASVSLIFTSLFARDFGVVNWLLSLVHLGPVDWHSGQLASWTAVSAMVDWRWTGYNALIYLAAMQTIPFELYEAAAIDGASRLRQFVSVTIPSLRPTIIFTVIVTTIGSLQLFGEPYLFDLTRNANGGAAREYQTVVLYLYQQFWFNGRYGYASAVAWGLFLVIVLAVVINLVLTRRISSAED